jgi:hypothetical protein
VRVRFLPAVCTAHAAEAGAGRNLGIFHHQHEVVHLLGPEGRRTHHARFDVSDRELLLGEGRRRDFAKARSRPLAAEDERPERELGGAQQHNPVLALVIGWMMEVPLGFVLVVSLHTSCQRAVSRA